MSQSPSVSSVTTTPALSDIVSALDTLVADAMAEWKIPGLALAVVQDGRVTLSKGYGHRDVEAGLPVTADTRFTICSTTHLVTLDADGQLQLKPDFQPTYRLRPNGPVEDLIFHQPNGTFRARRADPAAGPAS